MTPLQLEALAYEARDCADRGQTWEQIVTHVLSNVSEPKLIQLLASEAQAGTAIGEERWTRIITRVLDAFCEVGGTDASRAVMRVSGNYRQRRAKPTPAPAEAQ